MTAMIKAVIVDFDDTLCLTQEACFYLENEVLKKIGAKTQKLEIHKKTWGQPLFEAIKIRSPGVDVEKFREVLTKAHMDWVDAKKIDAVTPENLQALDMLLDKGEEVFILTSRTKGELRHILAPDHDLASRVKAFYYRDIMLFHKPDPRAFSHLLEDYNLRPEECVYVGDSPSDAQAAKGAGLHFVACLEAGIRTRNDFASGQVDAFIDRFVDLPSVALTERLNPAQRR